jgi:uncharacterized membrane protein
MKIRPIRPYQWASLALVIISFGVAFWAYPQLPEQVASHWNAAGEVDGQISRFWGAFLMPVIAAVMWPMMVVLPVIDPRSKNIDRFSEEFDQLIFGLFVFLLYVYGLTLYWNFEHRFNLGQLMMPALGLLFILVGRMVAKAQSNFTAGIRTPWTLSSERVWRETHDLGGKLFIGAGVISLAGFFWPEQAIYLVLVSVMGAALITVVYSYFSYRREQDELKATGQDQVNRMNGSAAGTGPSERPPSAPTASQPPNPPNQPTL